VPLRFTQRGIEGAERGDIKTAHESFVRAQDVVAELLASLNMEEGGEFAQNLVSVYDYAHRQLVLANTRKDPKPGREVIKIFRELGSAWYQIAQTQRQDAAAAPA
jgi:flagellar secretion chaperone FliS